MHPLVPSAPVCGVKDGSEAIAEMERVKFAKYADACRGSHMQFIPFVLSTFGKLGGEGDRFFQHLASCFRRPPRPRLRQRPAPGSRAATYNLHAATSNGAAAQIRANAASKTSSTKPPSEQRALADPFDEYAHLDGHSGHRLPRRQAGEKNEKLA